MEKTSGERILYRYAVPASCQTTATITLPKAITLRVLTAGEELIAARIGRFDFQRNQYEAAKLSIVALDDRAVSDQTGEVSKFWEHCGPRLRALLLQAYNHITGAPEEDSQSFMKSEVMSVG